MIRFSTSNRRALGTFFLLLAASCGSGGGTIAPDPDGGGGGDPGPDPDPDPGADPALVSAETSGLDASIDFGVRADGVAAVALTVTVRDADGNPLEGHTVELSSTGDGNVLVQPADATDESGVTRGTLASTVAEVKVITARVNPGDDEVLLDDDASTEFVLVVPGTYFVRTGGDDSATGDSPAEAWGTIGRALLTVGAGDTVHVGAGTYTESLELGVAATEDEPLSLFADEDGTFTGDAGEVLVDAGGADYALHLDGAANVLVRGFCVTGATPGGGGGGGFWITGGATQNVALVGNRVFDCGLGVLVQGGAGIVVEGNSISNQVGPDGDGISIAGGAAVRLSQNLVYNNGGHGVRVFGAGSDVRLELSTLYLNGGDQVRVQGTGSQVEVVNNVIADGLAHGLHFDTAASADEHHNLVWGHSGVDFLDHEGGSLDPTSPSSDPLFVNPAGSDGLLGGIEGADDRFHVDAASAVLDAGDGTATGTFLVFGGPLSGYTSRLDGVLDGEGADGADVNLGFHYPAQVDPFTSLTDGDARVFFGRELEVQAVGRVWEETTASWLPETKVDPANAKIRWVESRVSPVVGTEELLAVLTDDGTVTTLFLRRWDGKLWSDADVFQPALGGIQSADSLQRGFDLEYENASGDALVVYADGGPNPRFRTLIGGAWSKGEPVFAQPLSGGRILWVELVSRPDSDEIALVCLDDQERLTTAVWDGAEWSSQAPTVLDTQIAELRDSQPFDAVYETLSGDLLVAWGYTLLIEETRYAVKPAGSTAFSVHQLNSTDAVGTVVRLAADPTSDRVVAAYGEGDTGDDVVGMMWDGDAWGHIAELDAQADTDVDDLSVAWVGQTGIAIFLYRDTDGPDSLDWALWNSGGWKTRPDAALPIGDVRFFEAQTVPSRDEVMAVVSNANGELFSLRYDGTDWTLLNSGLPLGTQIATSTGPTEPFSFAFRR